jgi:hypothetical protein
MLQHNEAAVRMQDVCIARACILYLACTSKMFIYMMDTVLDKKGTTKYIDVVFSAMFLHSIGPIAQLWLERTPDKREVSGSSPLRPIIQ